LIVGQTGSGKTELAKYLLARVAYPVIIYDTKDEPALEAFADVVVDVSQVADVMRPNPQGDEPDIIVAKVPPETVADAEALDALLHQHYMNFRGWGAYLDEAYMWSQSAKAGPGLTGLLTRGRSRGISTVVSTQRPRWVSRFVVSEAQHVYLMRLVDGDDYARMGDIIPNADNLRPKKYHFFYYEVGSDVPIPFSPIKIESGDDHGPSKF
jgi:DNA helicase HerA-like ATPase